MRLASLLFALVTCGYPQSFPLESIEGLKPVRLNAEAGNFKGKKAVKVTEPPDAKGEDRYVLLPVTDFQDGTIEAEMTGRPASGAMEGARGFVGIAFRLVPDTATKFEMFYLRPTNGRADDQVRRNHSAQYVSFPDFPWFRLRKEFPEKYESYVDLVPAEWTKVKIEVKGATAKLFVHGNAQPTLIVSDLKHNVSKGGVGLWIGPGTEAHFANVKVTKQ
jgi:hypothetical protein